jgi:catechol 2,3-dioxygenase-like lactoylglutathione lyase family enzyme
MSRLTFIALNVSSLDRSVSFYRDALGIDLHASHNEPADDPWLGGPHASYSWSDGAYIHFAIFPALPPERPVSRGTEIGFDVPDVQAAHQRALAAGVEVAHAPRAEPWGTTARYRDPDGNLVSVTER